MRRYDALLDWQCTCFGIDNSLFKLLFLCIFDISHLGALETDIGHAWKSQTAISLLVCVFCRGKFFDHVLRNACTERFGMSHFIDFCIELDWMIGLERNSMGSVTFSQSIWSQLAGPPAAGVGIQQKQKVGTVLVIIRGALVSVFKGSKKWLKGD